MSHPKNKRERFLIGKRKGYVRAKAAMSIFEYPDWLEFISRSLRNTTKRCSCETCGNPRKHFNELTMQEKKELGKDIF